MKYFEKYQRYKQKYLEEKKEVVNESINKSYERINKVLNKLDKYYDAFSQIEKTLVGGNLRGGARNNIKGGNSEKVEIDKDKIKKYKTFIKRAKRTIEFFKTIAEQYYNAFVKTNLYYNQMLGQLKIKRGELSSLQTKVNDLSINNARNVDKIEMLEVVMKLLENLANNPMSVDLNLKSKLGKDVLEYDTKTLINGKTVSESGAKIGLDQVGGVDMDLDDFESALAQDIDNLKAHAENMDADKSFIDEKIKNLKDRMRNVVDNSENIFKIRAKIEWIVNELEKKVISGEGEVTAQDYKEIYENISQVINDVKDKSAVSDDMIEYVAELEKYASYLENLIKSTQTTVDAVSEPNLASANTYADDKVIEANAEQVGGNIRHFKYMRGGESARDRYIGVINKQATQVNTVKSGLDLFYIDLTFNSEVTLDADLNTWSKINDLKVQILPMLKQLDNSIKEFKIVLDKCNLQEGSLPNVLIESDLNKMLEKWDKAFSTRNTTYYKNLLSKQIYVPINFPEVTASMITVSSYLINLNVPINDGEESKIKFDLNTINDEEGLDSLIGNLNNSIVFYKLAIYFLMVFFIISKSFKDIKYTEITVQDSSRYLDTVGKSYISTTFTKFESYLKTLQPVQVVEQAPELTENMKGGFKIDTITSKMNGIENIPEDHFYVYNEFFDQYIDAFVTKSDASPPELIKAVAIGEMAKISDLNKVMTNLYKKIAQKLNQSTALPRPDKTKVQQILDQTHGSFYEFYQLLQQNITPQPLVNTPPVEILNKVGGGVDLSKFSNQPRLYPYLIELDQCREKIKEFLTNIDVYKQLTKMYESGDLKTNQNMEGLLNLYNQVQQSIQVGINGYIKIIPMIFFTIEFPPIRYADSKCKYTLVYDENKEKVVYSGNVITECPPDQKLPEGKTEMQVNAHAGFFKSNSKNGTQFLLEDSVIGLEKLVDLESSVDKPINQTINMMFALGASGTGKTTRYFGVSGPGVDKTDNTGIVPRIIQKSYAKKTDEDTTFKVEIAYFVSYGQKDDTNLTDSTFKEFVIFFDINKVFTQTGTKTNSADFYNIYQMATNPDSALTYTEFYTKLVNKKLIKTPYSNVADYIENGTTIGTPVTPSPFDKSFREILKTENIWTAIGDDDGQIKEKELTDLFEKLIDQQKVLGTVLPTRNNIESSRGHTCVLIKITENGMEKYFPLFDMAGTENTTNMNQFLTSDRNSKRMGKLIKEINKITQEYKLTHTVQEKELAFASLMELLEDPDVVSYVKGDDMTGGKAGKNIKELKSDWLNNTNQVAEEYIMFLNKIVKEGFYINHTIGMLIFAAMCVGKSIQTTKTGETDYFDSEIGPMVFGEMSEFTCITPSPEPCDKTRILLPSLTYDSILSNSCIWTQILFSFLYWNNETKQSSSDLVENIIKGVPSVNGIPISQSYLCDCLENPFDSGLNVGQAIGLSKNASGVQQSVQLIIQKINDLTPVVKTIKETIGGIRKNQAGDNIELDYSGSVGSKAELEAEKARLELEIGNKNKELAEWVVKINNPNLKYVNPRAKTGLTLSSQDKEKNNADTQISFNLGNEIVTFVCQNKLANCSGNKKFQITNAIVNDTSKFTTFKDTLDKIFKGDECSFNKKFIKPLEKELDKVNKSLKKFEQQEAVNKQVQEANQAIQSSGGAITLMGLLDTLSKSIKYDGGVLYLVEIAEGGSESKINLVELFDKVQKIDPSVECNESSIAQNQMQRIKDGILSATKMTLMHLVTGQGTKLNMVKETFGLTQTLWDATNIDVSGGKQTRVEPVVVEESAEA